MGRWTILKARGQSRRWQGGFMRCSRFCARRDSFVVTNTYFPPAGSNGPHPTWASRRSKLHSGSCFGREARTQLDAVTPDIDRGDFRKGLDTFVVNRKQEHR